MKTTSKKKSRGNLKAQTIQSAACEVISPKIPYLYIERSREIKYWITRLPEKPVIALDLKYTFDEDDVYSYKDHYYSNCRKIQPIIAAVALFSTKTDNEFPEIVLIFDLKNSNHRKLLDTLLKQTSRLVGRNLKYQLLALKKLDLHRPSKIWDIAITNQVLNLDKVSKEAFSSKEKSKYDDTANLAKYYREWVRSDNALSSICLKHGIPFLGYEPLEEHPDTSAQHSKYTKKKIKDEAARNAWQIKLVYPKQRNVVKSRRLIKQLVNIQMPWITVTAEAQWHGLMIDAKKANKVRRRLKSAKKDILRQIKKLGFEADVNKKNVIAFLVRKRVIRKNSLESRSKFLNDRLENFEIEHPIIDILKRYVNIQKALDQMNSGILCQDLIDEENRTYPEFINLGMVTGRDLTLFPNVFNCPSILRPLVIAPPGRKLVEVDYGQIDIAVVAGLAKDEALTKAYNSDDVYATTAKSIFKNQLPKSAQKLASLKFKKKYPEERKLAKEILLMSLYGANAYTVAKRLGISDRKPQNILDNLHKAYPTTYEFLEENLERSLRRSYAESLLGFRRYTNHRFDDQTNRKELSNPLMNHSIQATASEVFKAAGIKLSRLLMKYDAHILVPLHDSFLVEAPDKYFDKVVRLTEEVMTKTLTEFFNKIKGKVSVNNLNPNCWNKDGKVDIIVELKEKYNL